MNEFEKYIYAEFTQGVRNIRHSPYAIGLRISYEEDDLRRPVIRMVTNTYEHAKLHFPDNQRRRAGDADDALEALWNDAYWTPKTEAVVGTEYVSFENDRVDIDGIALRKKWIKSLGLWYEDDLEKTNFDKALKKGDKIIRQFDELCLRLAKHLHPVIAAHFQQELPLLFFSRESPDTESMAMTYLANPAHLLKEYARFIRFFCGNEWGKFMESEKDKDGITLSMLLD